MVKVKSKRTGLGQEIPSEIWEKMKLNGNSRYYDVVSKPNPPKEVEVADYSKTIQEAGILYRADRFTEALEVYKRAQLINDTKQVKKKIEEITKKIG